MPTRGGAHPTQVLARVAARPRRAAGMWPQRAKRLGWWPQVHRGPTTVHARPISGRAAGGRQGGAVRR